MVTIILHCPRLLESHRWPRYAEMPSSGCHTEFCVMASLLVPFEYIPGRTKSTETGEDIRTDR